MLTVAVTVLSGAVVGLVLGLLGGGGSILAVPLMLYAVGIKDPHTAIGTAAVAVSASAAINLILHARKGNIRWSCAIIYAGSGSLGAAIGAAVGKAVDGRKLLIAFALAMAGVGVSMLRRKPETGDTNVTVTPRMAARLVPVGLVTGAASGFFGIGGGFLVVPGLMGTTNMVILHAVGSSLVAITAFGAATAASYAGSGYVLWDVAGEFIAGGLIGGLLGSQLCSTLAGRKDTFIRIFAAFIFATAAYIVWEALLR